MIYTNPVNGEEYEYDGSYFSVMDENGSKHSIDLRTITFDPDYVIVTPRYAIFTIGETEYAYGWQSIKS